MPRFRSEVLLRILLLLTFAVSFLNGDHPCTTLSTSDIDSSYIFSSEDTFDIQQLLLEGFHVNKVNTYNIRRFGFTADGGVEQCIIVNYFFQCDSITDEACAVWLNKTYGWHSDNPEAIEWSFLWSSFDTSSTVGEILLNLAIYDLRVFGFELCDVYKDPVNITLTVNSSDPRISSNSFKNLCIGLLELTALVGN